MFAKFADTWEEKKEDKTSYSAGGKEKKLFFERIIALMEGQARNECSALLGEFHKRRKTLISTFETAKVLNMKAQWRFVSGLGISNPLETGLQFDHTYGVPYLPGSSVKGVARAWAEESGWSYPECEAVFGPEESAPNRNNYKFDPCRGYGVFFDAYPEEWPELELDIINPHYKKYYEGKNTPPADWLSPEPTYFLTVKPQTFWQFVVAVSPMTEKIEKEVLDKAGVKSRDKLLEKAVDAVRCGALELGMGGKTAVGYGYFEPVDS